MLKKVILLLTAVFLLLTISPIWADTLKVAAFENAPYVFTKGKPQENQVAGVIPQLLLMIAEHSALKFEVDMYPTWELALEAVIDGKANAIIAYRTTDREQYLVYTRTPLFEQNTALFVKKGSDITYNGNLRTLGKYRLVLVKRMSYGPLIDAAVNSHTFNQVIYRSTLAEANKALIEGKADILVASLLDQQETLRRLGQADQISLLNARVDKVPTYIAFSLKNADYDGLVDKVDEAINALKQSGRYQNLINENVKSSF